MIWSYVILAYFSLFALGLSDNVRGPLFPEILKTFQVSDTQGAMFYGIASLLGFFGSYFVRFLIRRFTRLRTLRVAMIMMSLSLVGIGWAETFPLLLFFAALYGLSLGLSGVIQNILVTVGSVPARRQRMLSGLHATYGVASLLAPLMVVAVNALNYGWRLSFYISAAVAAAVFVGSFFVHEVRNSGEMDLQDSAQKHDWLTHAGQIYVAFAMSCYVVVEILMGSRLALYLRRVHSFDLKISTYYVTLFFVSLLAGRLLFTFFQLKTSMLKILSVSLILSLGMLVLGLNFSPVFLALSGLTLAPFYPLAMAYITTHYNDSLDSAISTTLALTYLFTVLMHGLVGYLTDVYGISKALWVGPIALCLAFFLLNTFEPFFRKRI